MKKCIYCGHENQDDAARCLECGTAFIVPGASHVQVSPEEQCFWDRMTFREFALLFVRLQALWVIFPAVVELTYLPGYLSTFFPARRFDVLPSDMKQTFYLALLRIALRVAVGIGVFAYADRLLSWLAKGLLVSRRAEPTAAPNAGSAGAPPASVS